MIALEKFAVAAGAAPVEWARSPGGIDEIVEDAGLSAEEALGDTESAEGASEEPPGESKHQAGVETSTEEEQ